MMESVDRRETSFMKLQEELGTLIAHTPPGERLPSEPRLAKQLGVSRATLREAMRAFEGQGIIRRRQGVGTFVISHTHVIESGLEVLESIETLARRIGLDVSMGTSRIHFTAADSEEALIFGLQERDPLVEIDRVILAEGRPVAFLIDLLPETVLSPKELKGSFTGSVLDYLLQRGTPKLANSIAEIKAVAATSEIARLLEIQRGDVLLCLEAKLYEQTGSMIDLSRSYFLPGYFRFHVVRTVGIQ
ncbi:MAG: GntR family transcriptional regulator [Anaerolineaceae bacterium]|nr:GntR family transcriptional regulator [Anaerolineaceae bacterium]